MKLPCTTIVIPCYNEAARFPVDPFLAYSDGNPDVHFLLVNDGSSDDTLALLNRVRKGREEQITVLDQPCNGGKGEAVRCGVLVALNQPGRTYVGFWDADMATPLVAIEELVNELIDRKSVV